MRTIVLAFLAVGCRHPAAIVDTVPAEPLAMGSGSGSVDLGGKPAGFDYTFDRNALVSIRATPRGVIALTESGNLIRFDASLALAGEAVASPPISCLGGSDRAVFAAYPGGLALVDPGTLAIARVAHLRGTPLWIGGYSHGDKLAVMSVSDRALHVLRFDVHDPRAPVPLDTIDVPANDKPSLPGIWLVDHSDQLWYGVDAGEWGGMVGRIDLATGKAIVVAGITDGVMGLADVDGEIVAYGGVTHMGFNTGFIARIAGDHAAIAWKHERGISGTAPTSGPPALPVVRVWSAGKRRRVLVWNQVFDVSPGFTDWKRVVTIPAQTRFGRPDSVGAYPAVRDATTVGDDVVLATGYDGLFRLHGDTVEPHAIANQLAIPVHAILPSTAGVFLLAGHDMPPWRPDRDGWYAVDVAPLGNELSGYELVARPGHAPWILAERSEGKGLVATWDKTGFQPVWTGEEQGRGALAIGDVLWMIRDGKILRFDGKAWVTAGTYGGDADGRQMTPVDDAGLVVEHQHQILAEVAVRPDGRAELQPATEGHDKVRAAIVDGDHVLVATEAGLRSWYRDRKELSPATAPGLADAMFLARDDAGRLWQASETAVAVAIGKTLTTIPLPMLASRKIRAFGYDPARGEILVGLGEGGLVRVAAR